LLTLLRLGGVGRPCFFMGYNLHAIAYPMFTNRSKPPADTSPDDTRGGFIARLRARINKGDSWLTYDLANLLPGRAIDAQVLEELETRLLTADVGVEATDRILDDLKGRVERKELKNFEALLDALRNTLTELLAPCAQPLKVDAARRPFVILVVGVNGSGKTTTIGKLARRLASRGHRVMLAAGDTFRAAAIEQLETWGRRNSVPVIAQQTGADPAAVIFDAVQAARARSIDVLIADTAGRLQTQSHLMDELKKVKRVIQRLDDSAPHEILLVLDAGLGQNSIVQAQQFNHALGVTGLVVTKLDGTAKGGAVIAMAERLKLPIRFIGIGEQAEDFGEFEAGPFVDALLGAGGGK
jgi:fused signal recognition particle receptor